MTAAIVFLGQYETVEKISSYVGITQTIAVVVAAVLVFLNLGQLTAGLAPQIPSNVPYEEVLPWLGFMLAGAAGLMWYSYWVAARGYGAAALKQEQPIDFSQVGRNQRQHLQGFMIAIVFII